MSLQVRLSDLITAVGTDYKQLRTWITGSSIGTLASLTTTDKTSLINAINEVKLAATGAPPAASETVAGVIEIATQAETNTGTDDVRTITPLKFQTRLAAFAQPLAANLTTLAAVASGVFGRTLLTSADAAAAKTSLGLAAVATSGSASDITTGTLPSSVIPLLAINDTFVVTSQAAMLALTAQRGDIAKRTDLNGQAFVLQADAPTVLANWIALNTTSDVVSVNGQTGVVILAKSDVGLANVDNTADTAKPVSTAQATANALKLAIAANLSDLNSIATSRTNLSVYSKAETDTAVATKQDSDADLAAIAALVSAADKVPYATGAGAWALATMTATARSILDDTSIAGVRGTIQVYSQTELGDPETDLVALYTTAKA